MLSAAAPLLSSSSAKIIEGEYIVVFKREASTDEGERERQSGREVGEIDAAIIRYTISDLINAPL